MNALDVLTMLYLCLSMEADFSVPVGLSCLNKHYQCLTTILQKINTYFL